MARGNLERGVFEHPAVYGVVQKNTASESKAALRKAKSA